MDKKISCENFTNPKVDPLIPHYPLKQPIQLRICTLCDITVQGSFQSAVGSSVCYCRTSHIALTFPYTGHTIWEGEDKKLRPNTK